MYRNWTREEDEIVLDNKLTRKQKSRKIGRSIDAIDSRIHTLRHRKRKISNIKNKTIACPRCGETRRIGKVSTIVNGKTIPTNYCIKCLTEYTNTGEIIPPCEDE